MGETADQIRSEIEQERDALRENIDELRTRAREAVDWRSYMEKRPLAMAGMAVGAGFLMAAFFRRRNSFPIRMPQLASESASESKSSMRVANGSGRWQQVADIFDNLEGAAIGFAAAKTKDFLSNIVPGFGDFYDQTAAEKSSAFRAL